MWFSIIVPLLVASVWISPALRAPKVWFGIFWVTLLGTIIWLGIDLSNFMAAQGKSEDIGLRLLFVLMRGSDIPVLQVTVGSLLAALVSWHFSTPSNWTSPPKVKNPNDATVVEPDQESRL